MLHSQGRRNGGEDPSLRVLTYDQHVGDLREQLSEGGRTNGEMSAVCTRRAEAKGLNHRGDTTARERSAARLRSSSFQPGRESLQTPP